MIHKKNIGNNMNTTDLMNTALKLAHLDKMPYDTDIIVAGENITK